MKYRFQQLVLPLTLASVLIGACQARPAAHAATAASVPPALLGDFQDDYGGRFRITVTEWLQQPAHRYRIEEWNVSAEYLIARNDSTNPSAPGLWTRIDWVRFTGMEPYTWGFCFTAYEAPTAAAARATTPARRDSPRSGCNGYPFSRMRRVESPGG